LLQLFLIPAGLVTIIVVVWLAFNWLAQMGSDPYAYVDALERRNAVRWQTAYNLAEALRDPRQDPLRTDEKLAARLVAVLEREIDVPSSDAEEAQMLGFMCSAVGRFKLPDVVLPALMRAADVKLGNQEQQNMVHFSAMRAVGNVVADSPDFLRDAHPEVTQLALRAADDREPLLRSAAAFLLGDLGTEPDLVKLRALARDGYPDVRFNAAMVLARRGDVAAEPALIEMLDAKQSAALKVEENESAREIKRTSIQLGGLHGVKDLLEHATTFDRAPLRKAVEQLRQSDAPTTVALEAKDVLRLLDQPAK
jgi:hypothetical protein